MLYIDSDNAMGSFMGDIDDGFALSALLASSLEIAALASVSGNISERQVYQNNQRLVSLFAQRPRLLHGKLIQKSTPNSAALFLSQLSMPYRIAALGPLTNVAKALELGFANPPIELLIVGGNLNSRGRFPPLWPQEFNLTKDKKAAQAVFDSQLPITLLPLELARTFQVSLEEIRQIPGRIGSFLYTHSKRWFVRARLLKLSKTVPLWDLVGSLYLIAPQYFKTETYRVKFHPRGFLLKTPSGNPIKAISSFEKAKVWEHYLSLFKNKTE